MIEVKNISKKFNNNVVLNGIDLNINKGDVVAIIGPSGTGAGQDGNQGSH